MKELTNLVKSFMGLLLLSFFAGIVVGFAIDYTAILYVVPPIFILGFVAIVASTLLRPPQTL